MSLRMSYFSAISQMIVYGFTVLHQVMDSLLWLFYLIHQDMVLTGLSQLEATGVEVDALGVKTLCINKLRNCEVAAYIIIRPTQVSYSYNGRRLLSLALSFN